MPTISLDRRRITRAALNSSRRRYPRLLVSLDAFYESASTLLTASKVELSLRGVFFPCKLGDAEGSEGVLRLAIPGGAMVKTRVVVVRCAGVGHAGMALRFVDLSDSDRLRLGAFLVRTGGLSVIPALEAHVGGWARLQHPQVRRELRHQARG